MRGRLGAARAALGAAALLIHATLLPVLHAEHGATVDLERALACAAAPASGAAALAAPDAVPAPAHDQASCPVCATFGRAGAAIVPAALGTGTVGLFAGMLRPLHCAGTTAPDLTRGAPRGPPAFVS